MNEYEKRALELGLSPEQAAQIITDCQLLALSVHKLPFEQAVKLTNCFQMIAIYQLNIPFEQAVEITSFSQLQNHRASSSTNSTIAEETSVQTTNSIISNGLINTALMENWNES